MASTLRWPWHVGVAIQCQVLRSVAASGLILYLVFAARVVVVLVLAGEDDRAGGERDRQKEGSRRSDTTQLSETHGHIHNNNTALMYGSDTWALRKVEQNLLERTETRMLSWMMGIKWIEQSRNEEIRARAGAANISEKIREATLRWLGHVERKTENV